MFGTVVSEEGNVRTIALVGECDMQLFPDVDDLFAKSVDNGFKAVRIDLRRLTFIDSLWHPRTLVGDSTVPAEGGEAHDHPRAAPGHEGVRTPRLEDAFPFEDGVN